MPNPDRRYVVCGLSNRGLRAFVMPLLGRIPDSGADDIAGQGRLVGILDVDRARVDAFNATILPAGHPPVAWFGQDAFDEMVRQVRPDAVIITSPDFTHIRYILPALRHGIDVITEKPMVSTAADAAAVLAAERASSASVLVTHNLRYTLRHRQIRRMIRDGAIGRPTHATLEYHVDIRHGASYFLRWNRRREFSGGLSVHKSTHHLDLVSWLLGQRPERVFAVGGRHFYGPASPHRPRDGAGEPLTGAAMREADPYDRAQHGSGVFPSPSDRPRTDASGLGYVHQYPAGQDMYLYDDEIDIEDSYSALVSFSGNASLAYSINFSSPWEGYRLVVNGTHGQIETVTGRLPSGEPIGESDAIIHRPLFGSPATHPMPAPRGGHQGADPLLRRDVFTGPSAESTEFGLLASAEAGALAVAAGEAVWRSIEEQRPIDVAALLEPAILPGRPR